MAKHADRQLALLEGELTELRRKRSQIERSDDHSRHFRTEAIQKLDELIPAKQAEIDARKAELDIS